MAIRLEKSGGLTMIYGTRDDQDDQREWNTRRSKLGVFAVAVAVVAAVFFFGPHIPGYALISHAIKAVVKAIW
jgi:hypothetical protein